MSRWPSAYVPGGLYNLILLNKEEILADSTLSPIFSRQPKDDEAYVARTLGEIQHKLMQLEAWKRFGFGFFDDLPANQRRRDLPLDIHLHTWESIIYGLKRRDLHAIQNGIAPSWRIRAVLYNEVIPAESTKKGKGVKKPRSTKRSANAAGSAAGAAGGNGSQGGDIQQLLSALQVLMSQANMQGNSSAVPPPPPPR